MTLQPEARGVLCPSCGEENPDRAKFCLACGAELPRAERDIRKVVTILFSDLVGSTALGERLDPEAVRDVLTRYYDEMRTVLERHGGVVEKFIGDAIKAVFGAPTAHEDDALRALHAAVAMRDRLATLNDDFEREWGVRLVVRTGVNTGEVLAGDPSDADSFVLGDPVNLAARLEQAAGPDEILVGELTRDVAGDAITVEPLEPLELKGKSEPVAAWRLVEVRMGPALARRADTPFVGRADERAALDAALRQALEERRCVVATIVGPPGIGKSRLAHEFTLGAEGARLVVGRCLPYGDGITYWPLAEIVKELGGDEPHATLVELLGADDEARLVADVIAAAVGLVEGGGQTEETFWAVRRLFEQLASERPLVVVVDDIHWAEPTLLDLLEYVGAFATGPILLLCLARPDLYDERPSWATPRPNAATVQLQPISDRDAATLIDELLRAHAVTEAARAQIAAAAEGNPLFIEQLLALNAEAERQNGGILVPPTLQALLAARIDRLARTERAVIERAAVEGRTFHRGSVVELLDEPERAGVGSQLLSLVRKEFIRRDETLFRGDEAFRFGHILIRDAAYDAIPKQLRAELHERHARWLERVAGVAGADFEEILAYHFEQAYRARAELGVIDAELAVLAGTRLGAAGRRAYARSDIPAAVNLLTRAVDLLPETSPARVEQLPELADALVEAGELAQAGEIAAEAVSLAQAGSSELVEWRARLAFATHALWRDGSMNPAVVEEASSAFERLGDELGLSRASLLLGLFQFWNGRAGPALEAFDRACARARRAGARREESQSLTWALVATWYGPTGSDEGIRRCREVLERPPDRRCEAFALMELGPLLAMQGRFDEARSLFAQGHALIEDLGLRISAAGASQELYDIEWLAGNPVAAERVLRVACATLEEMGERGFLATRLTALADVLLLQGKHDEAERTAEQGGETAPDDLDVRVRSRIVRARCLARRGELEHAERLAREAAELVNTTDWLNDRARVGLYLAEVLELAGDRRGARTVVEDAVRLFDEKQNVVGAARARARLAELTHSPG